MLHRQGAYIGAGPVRQRSTVTWQGTAAVSYRWGRFEHSERLIYEIDDAH